MEAKTVESIINKIDLWDGKDVKYEVLSRGITNYNYTVHANGGKYVLRVPGHGTELMINRDHEQSSTRAAADAGVTCELVNVVKPEDAMVVKFIEGETMHPETIAADDGKVVDITRALKKLHTHAVFEAKTCVFEMIPQYIDKARSVDAVFPHDFDWMLSLTYRIEKAMDRNKPKDVACHNDLLSENFIVDPQGKMWILDWEYGGMNDPYFDLGDFAVEHPLTKEQEELIIKTYCGELKTHRLYRMYLHKITADVWWGLWAIIQDKISQIDFDFYDYGVGRFERLRRNAYSRDLQTWIDGV